MERSVWTQTADEDEGRHDQQKLRRKRKDGEVFVFVGHRVS